MSHDRAAVGRRLKVRRIELDRTQAELVHTAGISRKTLYKIEQGDPSVSRESLMAVCHALGVNEDGLTDDSDRARADDAERLLRTLMRMPVEVRVAMVVYGGYLSKLSPAERAAEIDRMMLRTME